MSLFSFLSDEEKKLVGLIKHAMHEVMAEHGFHTESTELASRSTPNPEPVVAPAPAPVAATPAPVEQPAHI
jgi:hypothetical protein